MTEGISRIQNGEVSAIFFFVQKEQEPTRTCGVLNHQAEH